MATHPVKAHVAKRLAQRAARLQSAILTSSSRQDKADRELQEFFDYLDTLDDQVDRIDPYEDEAAGLRNNESFGGRVGSMRADHKVYHPPTPPIPSSKASVASRRSSASSSGSSSAASSRVPSFNSHDSGYFSQANAAAPAPVAGVRSDERPSPRPAQRPFRMDKEPRRQSRAFDQPNAKSVKRESRGSRVAATGLVQRPALSQKSSSASYRGPTPA